MSNYPKIFSFFSGSGFLDLGFELSNYEIVYVSEIFPPFMKAYLYSRQCFNLSSPEYGYHDGEEADITQLTEGKQSLRLRELIEDAHKTANIIGFIGGPPCPDFSVGGKNRGSEGDKGKLSASYVELICQQKPDFFLFENVKGLWRTKKHYSFYKKLKNNLQLSDYILVERLINAMEYGVPQDRDRIILIGFHKNLIKELGVKLDTSKQGCFPWENHVLYPKQRVFSLPWPSTATFEENSILRCPDGIVQELTVEYWFRKNDVINHPNAQQYFQPKAGIKRFVSVEEGDDSRKSYKRLHRWRYSPTVCYGNNEVHLHPYKVRRISVSEALAIQSLPKEFTLPEKMSLTNMFKTIGNGVPYLAAKAIAQTILDFLGTVP
ncbi:MAG: DNA cytosine methyltransferase [Coleofasciculus sp. S288]|nr:DNA cytosine methyltransferase [Coleofasciculus sp. S288]